MPHSVSEAYGHLARLHPGVQALLATGFTWLLTLTGSALVFFLPRSSRVFLDAALSFTGGVMVAASSFSLLLPAFGMGREAPFPPGAGSLPVSLGFLGGGLFLHLLDRLEVGEPGRPLRADLLVLAITLHNIPEGLAVGVAFGASGWEGSPVGFGDAAALALGIGAQDVLEGLAVSLPLRQAGMGVARSFFYGQLSGLVEPLAGVPGALSVSFFRPLLPWAMGFAAGAMIFVVVEEVIPKSRRSGRGIASLAFLLGFLAMSLMDLLW